MAAFTQNLDCICFEPYANVMKDGTLLLRALCKCYERQSKHPLYIESFL